MLPADSIRCAPDTLIVVLHLVPVHGPVHKRHGVEHNMGVKMGLVQVGGDDRFIAVPQQALSQLYSNGVGLVWRHFSRCKGLNDMVSLSFPVFLAPPPLGVQHILIHPVSGTVDGCLIADALRLCPVQGVVDGGFQGSLFRVLGVTHAFVQPIMND